MEYDKEANKTLGTTKRTRSERAYGIVSTPGGIRRLDEDTYQVKSQSGHGFYLVRKTPFGKTIRETPITYPNSDSK